jgi:hypothetical protein
VFTSTKDDPKEVSEGNPDIEPLSEQAGFNLGSVQVA